MTRTTPRRGSALPHTIGAMLIMGGLVLSGCTATGEEPVPSGSDAPVDDTALPTGTEPQPLAERTTITINTAARIEVFSALFLAEEMGEFDRENIDVEFTQIASSDALVGLAQNQIQMIGAAPNGALFNAIHEGVGVSLAIPCHNSSTDSWWVLREVADQGAAGLAGSTWASAVGPGGSSILGLDNHLLDNDLTLSDVTVQSFPAADVPQALIQGAVDGAFLTEPGATTVEQSGVAVRLDTMPVDGGSSQCVYAFGPELTTERPEVGAAVIRAIARTVDTYLLGDYKADPETVQHIATALERTVEEIEATPSLEFDPELRFQDELFTRMQEVWLEVGEILSYDEPIPAWDMIDHRFVEALHG